MNTFKKFDYVRVGFATYRVGFASGSLVYCYGAEPVHYSRCTLVEPKFKPGDVVKNNVSSEGVIDRVKTEALGGKPYTGPLAYEYANDGGWDLESSLILVRRASTPGEFYGDPRPTLADVFASINAGKKIEAIKAYRTIYGVGLKEAKDTVEAIAQFKPTETPAPKFKKGDKVNHLTYKNLRGEIGVIDGSASYNPGHWRVDWPLFGISTEVESDLALAPKSAPHIVAIFKNGKYRPNSNPFIHETEFAAVAEAERLSRKHPGVKFGTFALVADSETPLSPTKTVRA